MIPKCLEKLPRKNTCSGPSSESSVLCLIPNLWSNILLTYLMSIWTAYQLKILHSSCYLIMKCICSPLDVTQIELLAVIQITFKLEGNALVNLLILMCLLFLYQIHILMLAFTNLQHFHVITFCECPSPIVRQCFLRASS